MLQKAETEGPDPTRAFAIEAIGSQVRRFPDLAIGTEGTFAEGRDGAFAHAIVDGVLRRWLTLEFLIGRGLKQAFGAVEPDLRAVLLAGAAQLLLLDRVPDHAAIDQSVRHAKARIREGAGGLVNAALRRVAELKGERGERPADWARRRDVLLTADGRAMRLSAEVLPQDFAERLSVQTSHPEGLLRRWIAAHGEEIATGFALKGISPAPTILNIEADEQAGENLVDCDMAARHEEKKALVWTVDRMRLRAMLERSRIWVQDPSSADVVRTIAGAVPGAKVRRVVDLCAGQGTKTRQLLRAFPNANVLAADVDGRRLEMLRNVFGDDRRVKVEHADAAAARTGEADLVLLDVPCSNSGVLARRVEARYRINGKSVAELVGIQRSILERGAAIVREGGIVAYSTCSLEPEENSQQNQWACEALGLSVVTERGTLPRGGCGLDEGTARDGSYVVVMRKGPQTASAKG
ncbi:MAG: hypothetical protein KF805_02930 [Phycisphaeraceae bacterium]|nr:hypothetical protein [Phycisphaeraceae bacterium]